MNAEPISIVLDPVTLRPFADAWRLSTRRSSGMPAHDLAVAVRRHAAELDLAAAPAFVASRLVWLPQLATLIDDAAWPLEAAQRDELAGALLYFCDPQDLIPDRQPRFGLLDDALVLEMALQSQRAEWREWLAFDTARRGSADGSALDRDSWLALHRSLAGRRHSSAFAAHLQQRSALPVAPFRVH